MKTFIKLIGERAWKAILTAWTHPFTKTERVKIPKPNVDHKKKKKEMIANANSKALCDVFYEVDVHEFRRISKCIEANEA
ncbi:hypothetical protein J1N35_040025 [Gossypium stocksii]|uniref:Uncharacterized protein n=1 Tax=Gossypium stocksii TaxID=47602 RepID=A0A9D3UCW2_9ROSI|nr:hypothetical protein J1N35_040025 [Gossypium stocksii]